MLYSALCEPPRLLLAIALLTLCPVQLACDATQDPVRDAQNASQGVQPDAAVDDVPPPGEQRAASQPLRVGSYAGSNVIVLSVDTLRADHLGHYGYERETSPQLDRIAGESLVFDRGYAPRGQTWPALASILTGLHPASSRVRTNGDLLPEDVPTLMTLLQEQGYATAAFVANACDVFDRGIDHRVCGLDKDEKINQAAIEWVGQPHGTPFVMWVHYRAPHEAYAPPSEFDVFGPPFREEYRGAADGTRGYLHPSIKEGRPLAAEDRARIVSLYDGEVLYTDALVRRLWQALERRGLLDESVVVFTSDHGEELGEHHNYYYHSCSIYEQVLRVPLWLRFPDGRLAGHRVSDIVGLIDIVPTLMALLGVEIQAQFEGTSLLALANRDSNVPSEGGQSVAEYFRPELGEVLSLRTDRWRYVLNPDEITTQCKPKGKYFKLAKEELYDHRSDPGEQRNVVDQHPELAAELRATLESALNPERASLPAIRADPEVIEQLKAIGYLGDE